MKTPKLDPFYTLLGAYVVTLFTLIFVVHLKGTLIDNQTKEILRLSKERQEWVNEVRLKSDMLLRKITKLKESQSDNSHPNNNSGTNCAAND